VSDFIKHPPVDNGDGTFTFQDERVFKFNPGALTGTWGQVGLYTSTSVSSLFAGQQIKDTNGGPTTLTVTATEEVTLKYSIYFTIHRDVDPNIVNIVATDPTGLSTLPTLLSSAQTVNGQATTLNIRGWTSFISPSIFRAVSDIAGTAGHVSKNMSAVSAIIDDGAGTLSIDTLHVITSPYNLPYLPQTVITPVVYGKTYKYTQEFTVPYQAWEGQLIKALRGHSSSGYIDPYRSSNTLAWIEFNPPINKGVGNEIRIKLSLTFEFS
jgi:hypothetical protein